MPAAAANDSSARERKADRQVDSNALPASMSEDDGAADALRFFHTHTHLL